MMMDEHEAQSLPPETLRAYSEPTQADTGVMGVTRQAPTAPTGRLGCQLKAQGEEKGEDAFDKRFAIAKPLKVGRFVVNIDGDGPVFAPLVSGF